MKKAKRRLGVVNPDGTVEEAAVQSETAKSNGGAEAKSNGEAAAAAAEAETEAPVARAPKQYSVGSVIQISGDDVETVRSQAQIVANFKTQLGDQRAAYLSFEAQATAAIVKAHGEYEGTLKAIARKRGISIDDSKQRWNFDLVSGAFSRLPDQG